MLRHTALFIWRDFTTDEQKLIMKKGLAYLRYGCPSVRSVDFGEDLLGGSSKLLEIKPFKRTPLWQAKETGPPCNFDVILQLDFDDAEGLKAYNKHPVHGEVGRYDAAVCRPERTARVDWWYEGPPLVKEGMIRHTALYLWADGITDPQKESVQEGLTSLQESVPGVRSLVIGRNIGTLTTDFDLVLDVQFDNVEDARAYFEHAAQQEVAATAAKFTKHEWTAKITHKMASG